MKDNEKKFTLPMLEAPRTVRVKFRKIGNLQYISHLDLQRTFARVLVRAGLPLWYTKGFNPHIKMVFGMPLPVGCESECEFLDIRIEREMSCEEIKARLNAELTPELAVLDVYPAERKFTDMAYAEYDYTITLPALDDALVTRVERALREEPLLFTKRTKAGEKTVDVREFVKRATVRAVEGALHLDVTLCATEGKTVTPEALIVTLSEKLGILQGNPLEERYRILRRRVLLADESEFA